MARRSAAASLDDLSFVSPPSASAAPSEAANGVLIVWRCWVVISWLLLVGFIPPLQHIVQAGFTALHNALGPLADKIGHQHHAGKPLTAGPMPHMLLRPGDGLAYFVVPAALTVLWAAYRQVQAIRQPGTSRFALVSIWTAGSVAALVMLIAAAAAWHPTRGIAVAVIRAVAQVSGSVAIDVSGFGL